MVLSSDGSVYVSPCLLHLNAAILGSQIDEVPHEPPCDKFFLLQV